MKKIFLFLLLNSIFSFAQAAFNKLDEKGNKHGLWKGYYEITKYPKYEGTFEHGKEVGMFKFFDNTQSKNTIATREFNPKDNSAYTIFYDQMKNKVSEGKVVNKLYEGKWKYYHQASKTIMTIENYSNGKLEGLRSVFFPSGKIAEEISYKNDKIHGVYKKYTEKGIILEESNYTNGEYNGSAIFKDSYGNIASKGQFVNGKKAGVWQFFENGKQVIQKDMNSPENSFKPKGN